MKVPAMSHTPNDKAAKYAAFRAEFIPRIHGCVSTTETILKINHSQGGVSVDACDPKLPFPPFTDEWIYGLPPNEKTLRVVLDYDDSDWSPIVTILMKRPNGLFTTEYSGGNFSSALESISEALKKFAN